MASDATERDTPAGVASTRDGAAAPSGAANLKWPAGYRPKRPGTRGGGAPSSGSPAAGPRRDLAGLGLAALRVGPALMLLVVVLAAGALSPVFFTTRNLGNVLSQTAVIAILALAQLLVIVTRGIDLSVGSTLVFASVVSAKVMLALSGAAGTTYGTTDAGWGVIAIGFVVAVLAVLGATGAALSVKSPSFHRHFTDRSWSGQQRGTSSDE